MIVQLTDAGRALLESQGGPVTVTSFKLGDGYNYTPSGSDTNIHGTLVYTGVPTLPTAQDASVYKYSMYLDYSVGDFNYGEAGLFVGTTLFALASASTLNEKIKQTASVQGNAVKFDMYLQIQGSNYYLWMTPAVSDNSFRLAVLPSPDALPPAVEAVPNAYTIQGSASQDAYLAYTDTGHAWSFGNYAVQKRVDIVGATTMSVTINRTDYEAWMTPMYYGEVLTQITTSQKIPGTVRTIQNVVVSASTATINFSNPFAILPDVGDELTFYIAFSVSPAYNLPVATNSSLGGIKVGAGLNITGDGTLSTTYTYTLPTASASTLGGVKVGSNMEIDGGTGLLTAKIATTSTAGVVIVGDGLSVASDGTISLTDPSGYTLPPATTSVLGGVIVGTGLSVNGGGTITVANLNTSVLTAGVLGVARGGSGADTFTAGYLKANGVNPFSTVAAIPAADVNGLSSVATSGSYNDLTNKPNIPAAYTLPIATSSVLGGVKIGNGLAVAGDGTISAAGLTFITITGNNAEPATSTGTNSISVGALTQSTGTGSIAIGYNANATGGIAIGRTASGAGVAIGIGASATANATAVGDGATATNSGIAIGTNSVGGAADAVSVGAVGSTRRIINVSAGSASNEVITWDQLATSSVRGLVKGGGNVSIAADGTMTATVTPPTATNSALGVVKGGGPDITIAGDGTLNLNAQPYDIPIYFKGIPANGAIMARINIVRNVNLPANLTGSVATCEIAPTAGISLGLFRNTTQIGSVTFAGGQKTGAFTLTGPLTLAAGDILYLYNAGTADASMSDISVTIAGTR